MKTLEATIVDPQSIQHIDKRRVKQVINLGDGFVAFLMDTVENEETQITNIHFQSTVFDISGFLDENDFKPVPIESMDLIQEKLSVHRVGKVDMVLPFRRPPSRGNYLKYNPRTEKYVKRELVVQQLQVEGEEFIVVAMHPMWERAED